MGSLSDISGQGDCGGFFLTATREVIREDFADTENLVSMCFSSLISTSGFVRVLRSLAVGAVDAF